jgi:hypothetical protein
VQTRLPVDRTRYLGLLRADRGPAVAPVNGNYDLGRMTLRPVFNTMVTSLISGDQFRDIQPLHVRGQVMRYWPRFLDITRGLNRIILRLLGRGELQPCFVYVPRVPQPAYRSVPARRA